MKETLLKIKQEAFAMLEKDDLNIEEVRIKYLGKKGELTSVLRMMGQLSAEERPVMGQLANQVRNEIEEKIASLQEMQKAKDRLPDVVKPMQEEDDSELLLELVASTVKEALQNMNKMRAIEGEKLKADILSRVEVLKGYLKKVEERAPMVVANYREKLQLRMTEILGKVEVDEAKLLNEVAFFTDKANVDEEITRLKSHFVQAENILNKEQLVGRKLDFLVQEFNRETNTICSKSNDLELTNVALLMKSEIEKIREQIQNLE
ncbi:MAG: DUF1732 domain-containing protein [Clostridia bacterium]|nr:DUF1732 domain-containing protein [Clostridia bacterium]